MSQMLVASEGSSDGWTCRDFRAGARDSSFKGSRYIDLMMQTIAVLIDEMCCKAFVRICSDLLTSFVHVQCAWLCVLEEDGYNMIRAWTVY